MADIIATTFAEDTSEFISSISDIELSLFELRVDALQRYDVEELCGTDKDLVITVRRKEEGGVKEIPEGKRLSIFDDFLEKDPAFVDIELNSEIVDDVLDRIDGSPSKSILSHHDLEKTPDEDQLFSLLDKMKDKRPDIMKIVTNCNSPEDIRKMIQLSKTDNDLIAFCMGEKGMISRALSLKYCPMTYGSISNYKTAPGQLSVSQLRSLKEVLNRG